MIPASRFIVQSRYRDEWLKARTLGVTATAVAECATESGFRRHMEQRPFDGNAYTDFGNWAEPFIMAHAHQEYGILPNDWLIAGEDPADLGTPDGLSLDHRMIAEAKTSGNIPKTPKREHRDQCQWNMHVTGAERCLYLFQHRATARDGSFYLGLLEPLTWWIDRDDTRIEELKRIARHLTEARLERV